MATLLEKTRKINKLLQRSETVEYNGISKVLSNVLDAGIYIVSKQGEICGYALTDYDDSATTDALRKGRFPEAYVKWLNRFDDTQANPKNYVDDKSGSPVNGEYFTIVPIYGVGRRIGTLIIAR